MYTVAGEWTKPQTSRLCYVQVSPVALNDVSSTQTNVAPTPEVFQQAVS